MTSNKLYKIKLFPRAGGVDGPWELRKGFQEPDQLVKVEDGVWEYSSAPASYLPGLGYQENISSWQTYPNRSVLQCWNMYIHIFLLEN